MKKEGAIKRHATKKICSAALKMQRVPGLKGFKLRSALELDRSTRIKSHFELLSTAVILKKATAII